MDLGSVLALMITANRLWLNWLGQTRTMRLGVLMEAVLWLLKSFTGRRNFLDNIPKWSWDKKNLEGEFLSSLVSAPTEHLTAAWLSLSSPKTVRFGSFPFFWLVSLRHNKCDLIVFFLVRDLEFEFYYNWSRIGKPSTTSATEFSFCQKPYFISKDTLLIS